MAGKEKREIKTVSLDLFYEDESAEAKMRSHFFNAIA